MKCVALVVQGKSEGIGPDSDVVAVLYYRSGKTSLLPALPQDSPFATISVTSDGKLETSVRY